MGQGVGKLKSPQLFDRALSILPGVSSSLGACNSSRSDMQRSRTASAFDPVSISAPACSMDLRILRAREASAISRAHPLTEYGR